MAKLLTPRRRRGIEYLDDPGVDAALRRRSHRDIQLSNTLFGGTHAVLSELAAALPHLPAEATLLDVGTGSGELAVAACRFAGRHGRSLHAVGLDHSESILGAGARGQVTLVCGDACALPFADHSVDVVCCSLLLHHLDEDAAGRLLREMDRVARARVIVSDLRRSWVAVAGLWTASFALRFHPVSRHDGVMSILRGYTTQELQGAVRRAIGRSPDVRARIGYRLTASWSPA